MEQIGRGITAIYARVSTERQEQEQTVQSQLAELKAKVQADGFASSEDFVDQGYSRDNLVRPNLDRLRDLVSQGLVSKLYCHAPDRLASGYRLVLLYEEFKENGVDVIFLKGSFEDSAEGDLNLGMQGLFSQYEKVKITERTRRGRKYWATKGAIVGGHSPYGYRLIHRTESQRAHLEIDDVQAQTVKAIYRLLSEEKLSSREIAKRLTVQKVPTPKGAAQWQPSTIIKIATNTAYKGIFIYQKTERVKPQINIKDRYKRGNTSHKLRPEKDWIKINVPVIIEESEWQAVQTQLTENSKFARRNNNRYPYLLRGLIKCPVCGGSYVGSGRHDMPRYRCINTDHAVSSTGKKCTSHQVSARMLEAVVLDTVKQALAHPQSLVDEFQRRITEAGDTSAFESQQKQIEIAIKRIKSMQDLAFDAYTRKVVTPDMFDAKMKQLEATKAQFELSLKDLQRRVSEHAANKGGLSQLQAFCDKISRGFDNLDFEGRQKLLRLIVERIIVQDGHVRIETILPVEGEQVLLRTQHPE